MRFDFTESRLRAVAMQYVSNGPAATKSLRQQEVDGAMAFLLSDAAESLRTPAAPSLTPGETVCTVS